MADCPDPILLRPRPRRKRPERRVPETHVAKRRDEVYGQTPKHPAAPPLARRGEVGQERRIPLGHTPGGVS